jgi:hypothetical protein
MIIGQQMERDKKGGSNDIISRTIAKCLEVLRNSTKHCRKYIRNLLRDLKLVSPAYERLDSNNMRSNFRSL